MQVKMIARILANKLWHILSGEDLKSKIPYGYICMANVELYALRDAIKSLKVTPVNIVEIGSYCGGSTVIIAQAAIKRNEAVNIIIIDPFESHGDRYRWDYEEAFDNNMEHFGLENNIEKIKDTSFNASKNWDREIDFIFIDGDHEYQSVVKDIKNFIPYVKKGGLFAFHDYKARGKDGVRNAVNELVLPHYETVFYIGSLICFRK